MIKYTVRCAKGHDFEGWFKDSATFDKQSKSGQVVCPKCGNTTVERAPMAPRIAKSSGERGIEARARELAQQVAHAAVAFRDEVEKNCDYVGDRFAEEARRIHYGETEERGIYGEVTTDEARELDEEGVPVYRLPQARKSN